MVSFEKEAREKKQKGEKLAEKIDISVVKYFWQASPLTRREQTIPKFLRKVDVLKDFTDNELRLLSKYLHLRKFSEDEVIFDHKDFGIGFYFIYQGTVEISVLDDPNKDSENTLLLSLEKYDYFGELALLQDKSDRNARAIASDNCELIGIFKPDLEELIDEQPVVATKLLQSVSVILANRIHFLTNQIKDLKLKLSKKNPS